MESEQFDHPWIPDWPDRVTGLVQSMGYPDLESFLATMPAVSYIDVADEIGHGVAPIQVLCVQFKEAKSRNVVRRAAMDALTRHAIEQFPIGWGIDERPEYRAASALGNWTASSVVSGDCGEYENLLQRIAHSFKPPKGWIPTGPDDPVIIAAFEEHWPEKDGR